MLYKKIMLGLTIGFVVSSSMSATVLLTSPAETSVSQQVYQEVSKDDFAGGTYADRALARDTSGLKCFGQKILSAITFLALTLLSGNKNLAITGKELIKEGLIGVGIFDDIKIMQFHKDATWGQYMKVNGIPLIFWLPTHSGPVFSEHVSTSRKLAYTLGWLPFVACVASEKDTNIQPVTSGVCWFNYIIAEMVRQRLLDPNDSPRIANVIAILLAGGLNEAAKKVLNNPSFQTSN